MRNFKKNSFVQAAAEPDNNFLTKLETEQGKQLQACTILHNCLRNNPYALIDTVLNAADIWKIVKKEMKPAERPVLANLIRQLKAICLADFKGISEYTAEFCKIQNSFIQLSS